jgi:hypothetical protein
MLQPIQTNYSGCLFRSRLEARWAVFFDNARIKWEYEPEGFQIKEDYAESGKKWNYLPDFYLCDYKTWVEIKGDIRDVSDDYLYMLQWAVDWGGQLPHVSESRGKTSGILILSNIPKTNDFEICHPILQHYKGGYVNFCIFENKSLRIYENDQSYFDATWGDKTNIRKWLLDIESYQGINSQDTKIKSAYLKARKARFEHSDRVI